MRFTIAEPYIAYIAGDINVFANIGHRFGFMIIVVNIKKSGSIWSRFDKKVIEEFSLNFVGSATYCGCYYY
jgi:hypothetical protein